MKKLVLVLVVLAIVSINAQERPWTNGILTNPVANTVLAQFPGADADHYNIRYSFVVCSTAAAIVIVEKRDVANAVIWSQAYTVGANDCREPPQRIFPFAVGDYIAVKLNAGITGKIQSTIFQE